MKTLEQIAAEFEQTGDAKAIAIANKIKTGEFDILAICELDRKASKISNACRNARQFLMHVQAN